VDEVHLIIFSSKMQYFTKISGGGSTELAM